MRLTASGDSRIDADQARSYNKRIMEITTTSAVALKMVCVGCTVNVTFTGGAALVVGCAALGVTCLVSETAREIAKQTATVIVEEVVRPFVEEVVRPAIKKIISWLEQLWQIIVGPSRLPDAA